MQYKYYKQLKVISADSGAEFEKKFNKIMKEHATDDPEVEFREGFCAFITWAETLAVPVFAYRPRDT